MKLQPLILLAALVWTGTSAMAQPPAPAAQSEESPWLKTLATYNEVWTTQSKNSSQSMPLAGGRLGLNVWTENGEICFLMASPDCMDENGMQVKLGLVRLKFEPAVFEADFRQELRLAQSEILISGKTASGAPVTVKLWCGVNEPVVHVETEAGEPVAVTAIYETWSNYETKVGPGALQWGRRLAEVNARRLADMKAQGVEQFAKAVPDPLSGLTVGGRITAPAMTDAGGGTGVFNKLPTRTHALKTVKPVKQLDLCITVRMEQDRSLADWQDQLSRDVRRAQEKAAADRTAALAWWREFWDRSHLVINSGAAATDTGWLTGRNYQLFRYQLGANRNGRAMTLFNGGVFTCEGNPDNRQWEGCQCMAQNQRPMAWAALKTGDYDLLKVSLDFYRQRAEIRRLHTKKFFDVDGLIYPEALSVFGLDSIGTNAEGRAKTGHLSYHYTSGMEFALLMLEYGRFTGADIRNYLEPAQGITSYYDQYYQKTYARKSRKSLDENGDLVIYPSDALEIFHGCTNNTDVLCGLEALCQGLLNLPPQYLNAGKRAYYKGFLDRLPPITLAEKEGRQYVAPAKSYESVFNNPNMEFPNMYVCFPFNHFFLGRKGPGQENGIELARNTWDFGAVNPAVQKQAKCWYQSNINLARMGRTEEAKAYTLNKMVTNPSLRFPAFWTNYGFDHAPDTDHGAIGMIGMQEMIMQTDGKRILISPAWPAEWDCDFKLNAPYQTTVEGRVVKGKVIVDKVTPESRRRDIEMYEPTVIPVSLTQDKPATASGVWGAGHEAAKAVDGNDITRWVPTAGIRNSWLEVDLGKPMAVARAVVKEVAYPSVARFALEVQEPDGSWRSLESGTTLGAKKEITFKPVTAQKFRLNVLESATHASIEEFQLFEK